MITFKVSPPNHAASVDAPIGPLLQIVHPWRRATDAPRQAAMPMKASSRCQGVIVVAALWISLGQFRAFAGQILSQDGKPVSEFEQWARTSAAFWPAVVAVFVITFGLLVFSVRIARFRRRQKEVERKRQNEVEKNAA